MSLTIAYKQQQNAAQVWIFSEVAAKLSGKSLRNVEVLIKSTLTQPQQIQNTKQYISMEDN